MTPPPTSIDGTDITGATIDGTEVQEITVDGETVFTAVPTFVDISKEEDGDLSEYTGDTGLFSIANSPTISGSNHSISFATDGSNSFIETTFLRQEYTNFTMHLFPQGGNGEVIFVDSTNGNVVFCVYFSDGNAASGNGLYFSGSDSVGGSIVNSGDNSRNFGTKLTGVSNRYYKVEFFNIDYANQTLDISVDGTTQAVNEPFILPGVPDIFRPDMNRGFTSTVSFADNVFAEIN